MLRVAAVLAGTLMFPAAAHAQQLPAAHPPAKSVAGVRLAWPSATSSAPGATIKVSVRSSHRRTKLALLRATAAGKVTGAVARRTLRSGTFKVKLPATAGATYELRATIAGKRYWTWITTAPAHGATTPSPAPTPVAGYPLACPQLATTPQTATLTLDATAAPAGGEMPFRINDTSADGCLMAGVGYSLEIQQPDGSWTSALPPDTVWTMQGIMFPHGASMTKTAKIPADAVSGTYRIQDAVSDIANRSILLTSPTFQVTGAGNLQCDYIVRSTLAIDPATVTRGAPFAFADPGFANESGAWERQVGDDWFAYPAGTVDVAAHTAELPAGALAGQYRLLVKGGDQPCTSSQQALSNAITLP